MEKITESLLSGEKIEENFGLFCEYQMMSKIILLTKYQNKNINIIIIKNLGILIPSLQDKKILFYFFSHDYMNQIILNISSNIEEQDNDFLSYYINFLKTIANKLDISTLALFFHRVNNNFPLLDEASGFFNHQDVMIKNTSRNIFLSIIKLNYEPMIQYICDLPRITDLLLFADNIKSYIILLTNIKVNNDRYNAEIRLKEIEESLIDDILFMQDILSVGIEKINYILINCLFSIPLQFLFNSILTHHYTNIAFYVLNLIMKNIKNECINNLIAFVLYSSQIHVKINENIANQENQETYNLLYLNKFVSHHSGCLNIILDDYIILVFCENFLKSLRYIKDDAKIFEEIKEAAVYLRSSSPDDKKDVIDGIKIISEILQKNTGFTNILRKMEAYHNYISRSTGINIGISYNEANYSFLKIIYDNLLIYNNNHNLENNIFIQENILKKECFYFIDCSSPSDNQNLYLNQLFLLLQIINSDKISIELKKFLCINKYLNNKEKSNSDEGIHISDEPKDNIRKNKILNKSIKVMKTFEDGKLNLNNKDNNQSIIPDSNRAQIVKDFFNLSEDEYNMYNNSSNRSFKKENHLSSILLMPRPISSNNENIEDFDNSKQLIINKQVMNFEDMNFNNNCLNRLLYICNSKNAYENNVNLKSHDILLDKIINIIFNNDKYLGKLNYRLSFELIETLILGSSKCSFYEDKYCNLFNEKYKKILSQINEILLRNNCAKTEIYKRTYQYFEESFNLNKKESKVLMNECFENESLFFLLNIYKNNNMTNNNIINSEENKIFSIIDFPRNENEIMQCLFQILVGLYDLRLVIGFEKNNKDNKDITNSNLLLRNKEFPLKFISSNHNVNSKINTKELKVNPTPIIYKSKNISSANYYLFYCQNYLFIVSPVNDNNNNNNNNNNIENNDNIYYIIKQRLPLRQIVIYSDRGDPRTLYLLNGKNDLETTLFFDGVSKASSMKENINNAIKLAILKEFSAVKSFVNNLIEN